MNPIEIFPAIDLVGGRCVRLRQGKLEDMTVYDADPIGRAQRFAEAGAGWVHVVDLDRALKTGRDNCDVVRRIVDETDIAVQTGGGLRTRADVEAMLDAGAARVVLGTAALIDPDLVASLASDHPGRIVGAVDARNGEVAIEGWKSGAGIHADRFAVQLAELGVAALLATEVSRDGMLSGPDTAALSALLAAVQTPILASGGVSSTDDLRTLATMNVSGRRPAGVVVGKAIYENRFTVGEAVSALAGATR